MSEGEIATSRATTDVKHFKGSRSQIRGEGWLWKTQGLGGGCSSRHNTSARDDGSGMLSRSGLEDFSYIFSFSADGQQDREAENMYG